MLPYAGVAIATVSSILIFIDIAGNCLVCAIVKKNRDMRTPMNYLLVNLAVADILYAMFIAPNIYLRLYSTHPDGMTGTVLCKLLTGGTVAWIGAACSSFTLIAIAIERYYAVVYPLGNNRELTERKLKVIIPGSWMFSLIFCAPGFLTRKVTRDVCVNTRVRWLNMAYHWMWFTFIVLSMTLMVGFYSRVVYTLWFKRNDDNQLSNQQRGIMRVRKRVTLMVVTVTAIFIICWLNDMIVHIVEDNTSYTIEKNVYTVTHTMILFSSSANPFVYALISQTFRQKIKRMVCYATYTAAVHPGTREPHPMVLTNVTNPTHTAGPCLTE